MSNYLYQLVAKSFNLIDTIQPFVLSVFEPLPESTLDWESSMTTEETELETTSEAEKFPNFESIQSLESRSPTTIGQIFEEITNPLSTNLTSTPLQSSRQIPELTPNLAEEPDFELSLVEPFPESVLSQVTTDNLLLTPNTELETNNPPPITAPTRLAHKQLTDIDSVVSSVQSPELRSRKQFLTQPFSELEMISPATNQVASSPNSDPLKPPPVAETKPSLSSRVISVLTTESNTSLSNPIDQQSQPQPKSLSEQPIPIEINPLALSLQSPLKPDLQIYFDENLTVSFVPQEKTFSQPSLNTTIFRTVIAKENNTPVSRLVVEKLGELTTQSFNNQPIEINRVASLYTSPSDFSHYMDKSTRNLIPNQASLLGNGENLKPLELQKRGLESEKFERRFLAMAEPMLRASKAFQDRSFAEPVKSHTSPQVLHLPQSPTQVQTETSTILSIPSVLQQDKFATENLHKQPTEINQVFTHSLSPQVESFELSPLQLQSEATAMFTTGFANASDIAQVLPLTPALAIETITPTSNTAIHLQEQLVNELPQQQPLQITGNISSPPVQKLISSEILSSQILSQILEEPTAMSTTGFANTQSPDSLQAIAPIIDRTLSNSHKQTLTPRIDKQTNVRLPHSKLASALPEIPQRFVHKNVLSIQPLVTDASPKLSSLQTNSSTASFGDNLPSFVTSQPATQLAAIHSDIIPAPTPASHPSTAGTDIQPQVSFSDSHLSDSRGNEASVQEVGSQNHNTNYHKHTDIQKTNPNEGIVSSPVDNLILPQNAPPNLSMYAERDKNRVQSSYFRQLEESDLRPLSGSISDMTVKSLSVIATSSKKDQKRDSEHLETPPVIQVTIGRLEVRSTAPVPPLPRTKPRPATSVMSLNEYLHRRGGGKR
ncbi:MAG: hypothetical protein HWQ38_14495 [Nostoc sp. NMS7]|uniref:hypothetical protein n=1 Tax=Nostoc sp. NMS7 TaxID=2815391 RepID=UPI0025F53976|nr:hypothetical protein [Nostoc sp. NMS7]MBN3947594.1 hypothetical protein [Nostoc sp. NMS7]